MRKKLMIRRVLAGALSAVLAFSSGGITTLAAGGEADGGAGAAFARDSAGWIRDEDLPGREAEAPEGEGSRRNPARDHAEREAQERAWLEARQAEEQERLEKMQEVFRRAEQKERDRQTVVMSEASARETGSQEAWGGAAAGLMPESVPVTAKALDPKGDPSLRSVSFGDVCELDLQAGAGSVRAYVNIPDIRANDDLYAYLYCEGPNGQMEGLGTQIEYIYDYDDRIKKRATAWMVSGLSEETEYTCHVELYVNPMGSGGVLLARSEDQVLKTKKNEDRSSAFTDPLFRQAVVEEVRDRLDEEDAKSYSERDCLQDACLELVTLLNVSGSAQDTAYIKDISGVEYLVNLEHLSVHSQDISSGVEGVAGLKWLNTLYLADNDLAALPDLSGLSRLEELELDRNLLPESERKASKLPASLRESSGTIFRNQREAPALVLATDNRYYGVKDSHPFLAKMTGGKGNRRQYTLTVTDASGAARSVEMSDDPSEYPFIIKDTGLTGEQTLTVTVTDRSGRKWIDAEQVTATFAEDVDKLSDQYAVSGESEKYFEGTVSGKYTEDQVKDIRLLDADRKVVGRALSTYLYQIDWDPRYEGVFSGSFLGDLGYEGTEIDIRLSIARALPVADYTVVCTLDGKAEDVTLGILHVTADPTVTYSFNAYGYDNLGSYIHIELLGCNLDPSKVYPILKRGGREAASVVSVVATESSIDGGTGYVYRMRKREKESLWYESAEFVVELAGAPVDGRSKKEIYWYAGNTEGVEHSYYNWKKGQMEARFKESAGVLEGSRVTVRYYQEDPDSEEEVLMGSGTGTVQNGAVSFRFLDGDGAEVVPGRYEYAIIRYEVETAEGTREYEYDEDLAYYNYQMGDVSWYDYYEMTIRKKGDTEIPVRVSIPQSDLDGETVGVIWNSDDYDEKKVQALTREAELSPDGDPIYSGKIALTAGLEVGSYEIDLYQGSDYLSGADVHVWEEGMNQVGQSGSFQADGTFRVGVQSPKIYFDNKGTKGTEQEAKAYFQNNFKISFFDSAGEDVTAGVSLASVSLSGDWLYADYGISALSDCLGLYARVSDKDGKLLPQLGGKESYYAQSSIYYDYSEDYGCYEARSRTMSSYNTSGSYTDLRIYQAGKAVRACFTRVYNAEILKEFTISPGSVKDGYYDLTASDLGGLEDPARNVYSLHLVYADGNGAETIDGYFAPYKGSTVAVRSVTVSGGKSLVAVGGTIRLSAEILPADAAYSRILWSSSDPAVATVDEHGAVTGHKKGTAEITAQVSGVKSNAYKITVAARDEIAVIGAYSFDDPKLVTMPGEADIYVADYADVTGPVTLRVQIDNISGAEAVSAAASGGAVEISKPTAGASGSYSFVLTPKAAGLSVVTISAKGTSGNETKKDITVILAKAGAQVAESMVAFNYLKKSGAAFTVVPEQGYSVTGVTVSTDGFAVAKTGGAHEGAYQLQRAKGADGKPVDQAKFNGVTEVSLTVELSSLASGKKETVNLKLPVSVNGQEPALTVAQTRQVNLFYTKESGKQWGMLAITGDGAMKASIDGNYELRSAGPDSTAWYVVADDDLLNVRKYDASRRVTVTYEDYYGKDGADSLVKTADVKLKVMGKAPKLSLSEKSLTLYPQLPGLSAATVAILDENGEVQDDVRATATFKGKAKFDVKDNKDGTVTFAVSGTDYKTGSAALTLSSDAWNKNYTKPVTVNVKVAIKDKANAYPMLALSKAAVTLNGNKDLYRNAQTSVRLSLKGVPGQDLDGVTVSAAKNNKLGAGWQSAIDIAVGSMDELQSCPVEVSLLKGFEKAGSYKFDLSYQIGEKTLTRPLTVKVVNKTPAQSVTLKKTGKTKISLAAMDSAENYYLYVPKLAYACGQVTGAYVKKASITAKKVETDVTSSFTASAEDGMVKVAAVPSESTKLEKNKTYKVQLVLILTAPDGTTISVEPKVQSVKVAK